MSVMSTKWIQKWEMKTKRLLKIGTHQYAATMAQAKYGRDENWDDVNIHDNDTDDDDTPINVKVKPNDLLEIGCNEQEVVISEGVIHCNITDCKRMQPTI